MAYTILIEEDNSLMTTNRERIMQKSKLVDDLWFLTCPIYKGQDMSTYIVQLEYILPVSRKYCTEILELSNDMYEDHLKYLLPFDTKLTSEAGQIQIQLTFAKADLDEYGNDIQRVRKTSPTTIDIIPISAWSDIIPDDALSALDQRLIKLDASMKAMSDYQAILDSTKADNLKYNEETNELQLLSGDNEIGDKVIIKTGEEALEDGVPIVDLNGISDGDASTETTDCDVINF